MTTSTLAADAGWLSTAKCWYISIRANYDVQYDYGRSLAWLAPELRDAGLAMIEDHPHGPRPWRAWVGTVDADTMRRFADAWAMPDDIQDADLMSPRGYAHIMDGMNWEWGGESPIVCVIVRVRPDSSTAVDQP